MYTYLGHGARKLLRHKCRELDTASFQFRSLGEKSWIDSYNESFSSVGHVSS